MNIGFDFSFLSRSRCSIVHHLQQISDDFDLEQK